MSPPSRYKSTAKPWTYVPGLCSRIMYVKNKQQLCGAPVTYRSEELTSYRCKDHRVSMKDSLLNDLDKKLINQGSPCDVWKCTRKATSYTVDGYRICTQCAGN